MIVEYNKLLRILLQAKCIDMRNDDKMLEYVTFNLGRKPLIAHINILYDTWLHKINTKFSFKTCISIKHMEIIFPDVNDNDLQVLFYKINSNKNDSKINYIKFVNFILKLDETSLNTCMNLIQNPDDKLVNKIDQNLDQKSNKKSNDQSKYESLDELLDTSDEEASDVAKQDMNILDDESNMSIDFTVYDIFDKYLDEYINNDKIRRRDELYLKLYKEIYNDIYEDVYNDIYNDIYNEENNVENSKSDTSCFRFLMKLYKKYFN